MEERKNLLLAKNSLSEIEDKDQVITNEITKLIILLNELKADLEKMFIPIPPLKEQTNIIDNLARDNKNVYVLNADEIIPKNLEMYDDHVHLQRKAQKILGESACKHIKKFDKFLK